MPRYYFHTCIDGALAHDPEGEELTDLEAVKIIALRVLADLAEGVLPGARKKKDFSVEVHDEQGHRVLKTELSLDVRP